MRVTPLPIFDAKCDRKPCKRDKSTSRDFVARGRPLSNKLVRFAAKKRLDPLACFLRTNVQYNTKVWHKCTKIFVFKKTHQLSCKFRRGFHIQKGNFRLGRESKMINVTTILSLTLVSLTGLLKAERSIGDSFRSVMSFLDSVWLSH